MDLAVERVDDLERHVGARLRALPVVEPQFPGLDGREELPRVRKETAGKIPVQRVPHPFKLRIREVPEVRAVGTQALNLFDPRGDRLPERRVFRRRPAEGAAPARLQGAARARLSPPPLAGSVVHATPPRGESRLV